MISLIAEYLYENSVVVSSILVPFVKAWGWISSTLLPIFPIRLTQDRDFSLHEFVKTLSAYVKKMDGRL